MKEGTDVINPVETLTPYQVGKVLHKNAETIRSGLRQGIFPFGKAVPPEKPGGNWNYIIVKSKFMKFLEMEVEENENC